MKVLSLFDGMSCGMIALVVGNHNVERYVAFENETKYATKTASHNFPMIEQRGDVFEADFTEFEGFDLLCGGSPCTFWSIAQKNNRETEASGMGWELFCQYVRALKEVKPRYFIYENNKSMSPAIRESITQAFGFEPICINFAFVSAQNRNRLYWVGKRNPDGTYSKVHVEQPEDRGILLRDVLDGIGAKELSEREMDYMVRSTNGKYSDRWAYLQKPGQSDKALCITANVSKGVPYNIVAEPVCVAERGRYGSDGIEQHYEPIEDGKTNVLTTVQKDNQVCEPVRVGTYPNNAKNQAHDSQQYRIYSTEAKSVTLCGNGGGMGAKTGLYSFEVPIYAKVTEWDENGKPIKAKSYADGKEYPVYEVKDGQITIKGKTYPIKLKDGFYIIRKLTVRECMRLQTVPEWYEFPVSDSQAYKLLGNGWTVDVIVHILSFIKEGELC
jgi:DNA (cytosine-5)-methyltransferase 3A